MEEHFDLEMYIHAKLNFNQWDRVWLFYRGEYTPYIRERTCHNADDDGIWFECSGCGEYLTVEFFDGGYGTPRYCPNCGAKVVEGCQRLSKVVKVGA